MPSASSGTLETTPPAGFAITASRPWDQLQNKARMLSRDMVLEIVVRLACAVPGNVVEFGVADGSSTRVIQRTLRRQRLGPFNLSPKKQIFALDSFEGLREAFENAPVGAFAQPAPKLPGIEIVKGYFEDTCTPELAKRVGRVAFAHLDADLYSSTLCALRWLTPLLGTGSLLLFDEFVGADMSEARAFEDWRDESGMELLRIAEFDRDPSGWGHQLDRRTLFQVVAAEPLPPIRSDIRHRIARRIGLIYRGP
jgi:hypothetical protein